MVLYSAKIWQLNLFQQNAGDYYIMLFNYKKTLVEDFINLIVEETRTMIKQMKSEQLNNKIKENQRRIDTFRQIQLQVKGTKVSIDNTIEKISSNIQQKIQLMEKELENSESKTQLTSFEDDVNILSKNYEDHSALKYQKNQNIYQKNQNIYCCRQLQNAHNSSKSMKHQKKLKWKKKLKKLNNFKFFQKRRKIHKQQQSYYQIKGKVQLSDI
ncbi:unnamed protein product [Paramecium sonneborni]|uniref:Uncharacterized protein n=1 Tax=Paramecium sonneborni TaxID=65129 RepID=A0A8S1RU20_9CILI|nr:unnamed protein product [Paramecium sonneborni]